MMMINDVANPYEITVSLGIRLILRYTSVHDGEKRPQAQNNRVSEFRINRSKSRLYPILSIIRRILPFYLAETILSTHAIYLQ